MANSLQLIVDGAPLIIPRRKHALITLPSSTKISYSSMAALQFHPLISVMIPWIYFSTIFNKNHGRRSKLNAATNKPSQC